jgi:hypothetical protein
MHWVVVRIVPKGFPRGLKGMMYEEGTAGIVGVVGGEERKQLLVRD